MVWWVEEGVGAGLMSPVQGRVMVGTVFEVVEAGGSGMKRWRM